MNDENEIVPDDTGKQNVVAPAQEVSSPFPAEQVPATQPIARKPEFGDKVLFASHGRLLNATVQVAFADGRVRLRVVDPEDPLGGYDVTNPDFDTSRNAWYIPGQE